MNFRKVASVCVAAGMMIPCVHAQDSGAYVGASIGQSRQKSGEFEGDDTSFKLFGGWSFNKYFAVEGGYVDGGTQADTVDEVVDLEVSSKGFFVAGLAKLPLGQRFAPYVKLGAVYYDSDQSVTIGTVSASISESDTEFLYGGGLEFKATEQFRLRAEYEEVNLPDSSFDIFSLAATWNF